MEDEEIIINPYRSFVSDPDVESDLDRTGIRTTTQTDQQLLANVPDAVGLRFDPTNFDYTKDLYKYYGGEGLPMIDTATDTNAVAPVINTPITNVADTSSGTDSQITGSQDQAASGLNNVDTLDVPQINTAGQEFNVYTGEFDPNDEGTVFSDEALEDPAIANARLNSSFYVPNETNIPPEQPGMLDNISTAARDAFESVKDGTSTAVQFISDHGYTIYQALQGNLVAAGLSVLNPLTLGLGFAGKVFEGLGDTASKQEYDAYSNEQQAEIDQAYGPGGVMDGYNAVSGFGQGVQATVQSRLDQRRSSGIPDTSAASQELIGLQNNLGITDFTQLTQEQVSDRDDVDPADEGFTVTGNVGGNDFYSAEGTTVNSVTGEMTDKNGNYTGNVYSEAAQDFGTTPTTDPYADIDSFYEGDDVGKAGAPGEVLDTFLGPVASTPTQTYYDGGSETNTSSPTSAKDGNVSMSSAALSGSFYTPSPSPAPSSDSGSPGCFLAGTLITMASGSTKEIEKIDLRDNVAKGGKVFATGKFLVKNLHDYKGIKVSGSHMVNENNKWIRVEDSKHGKPLGEDEHTVYVFGSENRKILIKDILFTDYFETKEQEKLIDNEKNFFKNWKSYDKKINLDNVNTLNAS